LERLHVDSGRSPEPYGMLSIVKEVMGKEKFILLIIGKNSIDENVRKG
jgi:electron transfer flavoprotein alpha/beta subunit